MYDLPAFINDACLFSEFRACLREGAPVTRIRDAKIKLTSRCNLKCAFCKYPKMKNRQDLETDLVRQVIDGLSALDCRKIHFSGGESTLHRGLPEIIAHASSCGMRTSLTTNGTLITEDLASAIIESGLNGVTISLDSASPELHDSLRGVRGAFKRSVRGLKYLCRARRRLRGKTKIRINMVLTRHNYHMYPEVIALAHEVGATDVTPIPVDEGAKGPNHLLESQLQEFNEFIAPAVHSLREKCSFSTESHLVYPFGEFDEDIRKSAGQEYARGYFRDHICYAPWLTTMIDPEGAVRLCCMSAGQIPSVGNVRERSIEEIFLSPEYESVRHMFLQERYPACHNCDNYLAENRVLEFGLKASL